MPPPDSVLTRVNPQPARAFTEEEMPPVPEEIWNQKFEPPKSRRANSAPSTPSAASSSSSRGVQSISASPQPQVTKQKEQEKEKPVPAPNPTSASSGQTSKAGKRSPATTPVPSPVASPPPAPEEQIEPPPDAPEGEVWSFLAKFYKPGRRVALEEAFIEFPTKNSVEPRILVLVAQGFTVGVFSATLWTKSDHRKKSFSKTLACGNNWVSKSLTKVSISFHFFL